jgi:hypothetical protein
VKNIFRLAYIATLGALGFVQSAHSAVYELQQSAALRYNSKNILELKINLPAGTKIDIPANSTIANFDFRDSKGQVERSSTGFVTPLTVISVPDPKQIPQAVIDSLNATSGGIFISAAVMSEAQGIEGNFAVLAPGIAGAGYLSNYEPSGKPKFSFTKQLIQRFGANLNHGIDPGTQTPVQRTKWPRIWAELRRASDRTVATPKSIIMIDKALALNLSIAFENTGAIPLYGAWSIAVLGTAVRHGFPNVPCAEFLSEQIREAYRRAGYNVTDDFNSTNHNELIWSQTSAVTNLASALNAAGWVPWDTVFYKPPPGAILMNAWGDTPGHAYISAGDDGRFIVDNGSPQGRNLRTTTAKTIEMMYQAGLFFLPPGINPPPW